MNVQISEAAFETRDILLLVREALRQSNTPRARYLVEVLLPKAPVHQSVQLCRDFCSLSQARLDATRGIIWINGDTGITIACTAACPYDLFGNNLPPSAVAPNPSKHWISIHSSSGEQDPMGLALRDRTEKLSMPPSFQLLAASGDETLVCQDNDCRQYIFDYNGFLVSDYSGAVPQGEAETISAAAVDGDLIDSGALTVRDTSVQGDAADRPPGEWCVGDLLEGRYEVKALLGTGGRGRVYKVFDRNQNVFFAAKLLHAAMQNSEAERRAFAEQAELPSRLGAHRNLVDCYGVRCIGGVSAACMECMEGDSLKDWIENRRLYDGKSRDATRRMLRIAAQIACGLQYLHQRGVMHGNVKSHAVLFAADGSVKVSSSHLSPQVDAKPECTKGGKEVPIAGRYMTPAYCSPEQAEHRAISCKTDVWSWAVTVLEIFTGEVTWYSGPAAGEVLEAYLSDRFPDSLIPRMPDALVELLRWCFRIKPDERPTMQQVSEELSWIRAGVQRRAACNLRQQGGKTDPMALVRSLLEQARGKKPAHTIPGYTILKELGRSGMAIVYLARHERSGEQVALRAILPRIAPDNNAQQLFLREFEITKQLRHLNIVECRDAGCSNGVFFLAMGLCNGGSVDKLTLASGGKLRIEEAGKIIFQVLDGLTYLHNAHVSITMADGSTKDVTGVVHRDISPQNIWLSGPAKIAKVTGFELAKVLETFGLAEWEKDGMVAGRFVYMPRQQVINYRYAKPEVDVWATAACLYNLLTGHFPRDFPRGKDLLQIVLTTDAIPIRQRDLAIPVRLAEVIDHALRDKPEIPFKTAAELKRALEGAL